MAQIQGKVVDLKRREIFPGTIEVREGRIAKITRDSSVKEDRFILPGFIDSHVHIESSLLVPSEFARLAVLHGTVATISDPHEIANVCGLEGVRYMIRDAARVPFHFFFGASPCVPATDFETAGSCLGPDQVKELIEKEGLLYLSEVMNYPGVLAKDPDLLAKIEIAKQFGRVVDGHAPGLRKPAVQAYASAGITTDHECFTIEEARDKIECGMYVLIREGSAAKNFAALHPLFQESPKQLMFCTDDAHPDELLLGHINRLVARAISDHGHDLFDVLRAACIHPIEHYRLPVGRLYENDPADFIVVEDLHHFHVLQTWIQGQKVAENQHCLIRRQTAEPITVMEATPLSANQFKVTNNGSQLIRVIEALEGQLITNELHLPPKTNADEWVCDLERDLLKLSVVNRYHPAAPAVAFVRNFGLKKGALATSVAHDSHNILAVGTTDEALSAAVNRIIELKGGLVVFDGYTLHDLALPVAGLMSLEAGTDVAQRYTELSKLAQSLGCNLHAPFMTLAFMALLVIPSLKLSDRGLFDVQQFAFTSLFLEDLEVSK